MSVLTAFGGRFEGTTQMMRTDRSTAAPSRTSAHTPGPSALRRLGTTLFCAVSLFVGLTVAPTAGVLGASSASAAAPEYTAVTSTYDAQVLRYTNVNRARHGLKPLRPSPCQDRFAQNWARHMAAKDLFQHQALRPILRTCDKHTVGENIARGSGTVTATQVVRMWMNSPGHRANILNKHYRYLAVDAYRSNDSGQMYITQEFGG